MKEEPNLNSSWSIINPTVDAPSRANAIEQNSGSAPDDPAEEVYKQTCLSDLKVRGAKTKDKDSAVDPSDYLQPEEELCGTFGPGEYFGDATSSETLHKCASVLCLQNTHFFYIDRESILQIEKMIELRLFNEKLAFMREINAFKTMPQKKLKIFIQHYKSVVKIRGAYLFKEGEPCNHVYIVEQGQLRIVKKVQREKSNTDAETRMIFRNPLAAKKKQQQLEMMNQTANSERFGLELADRCRFLGLEDITAGNMCYSFSVVCESQKATVYQIQKADFLKFKNNENVWGSIKSQANQKVKSFSDKIVKNTRVEVDLISNLEKTMAIAKADDTVPGSKEEAGVLQKILDELK